MSKNMLAAGAAIVGLVLVAGVTRSATAAMGPYPPVTVQCYYDGDSCTYETKYGSWGDCDTTYPRGNISTGTALRICGQYSEN